MGSFIRYLLGKGCFEISVKNHKDVLILNLLKNEGFFGCTTVGEKIYLSCATPDIKRISAVLDKYNMDYKYRTEGFLWLLKRVFSRKGALTGLAVCLVLHVFFSSMIWKIEITGNGSIPEAHILKKLESLGVKEGTLKNSIDVKKLYIDYMVADPLVSYAHLNIDGTTAVFEVSERKDAPEKEPDKKQVCNIVARCNGVIYRSDVYSGGNEVAPGESVIKGQLLISSFFETRTVGHILRRAKGNVLAVTEPCFEMTIPKTSFSFDDGAEYKKYSLKLFDHSMAVKGMAPANANGKNQRFVEEKNISLFGFITLPVKYSVTTYTVYEKSEKKVSKAQAQKQYSEKLEEWKKQFSGGAKMLSEHTEEYDEGGFYRFCTKMSCIESIGVEKPFEINIT